LTAQQLKYAIEKSSTVLDEEVNKPGTLDKVKLSELSKTGGLLNVYAAIKLASTLKGERKPIKLEILPNPKLKNNNKG
jgi:hypothetical protein